MAFYRWVNPDPPADSVNLRTGGSDTIVIQDISASEPLVIGEVDRQSAPLMVYQGAIYLHEGRQFAIEALDWANGIASARQTRWTITPTRVPASEVTIIEEDESDMPGMWSGAGSGRGNVARHWLSHDQALYAQTLGMGELICRSSASRQRPTGYI